ncbi:MAG: hypothetical protein IKZ61_10960 [Prevotella sp.]|nr:hypothetical protein [Prevotella sp.]
MNERTHLYHCSKYDAIIKILSSGYFKPSYCLEELSLFTNEKIKMAYAVVCFADLLNEEVMIHMKSFHSDSYLRMSKKWAIKKRLSPVIYYPDSSYLGTMLKMIVEYTMNKYENPKEEDVKLINSVNLLLGYLKQYEGRYWNKKENSFSYPTQFYLEREWRYLPLPQKGEAYYIDEEGFFDEELKQRKQDELVKKGYVLSFTWEDIEEIGIPVSADNALIGVVSNIWKLSKEQISQKIHFLPIDSVGDSSLEKNA